MWATPYENTDNVTRQFNLLGTGGLILLTLSALVYSLQTKPGMHSTMRPYVMGINLITLTWFIALHYFRFKQSGRACSGDYLEGLPKPANYATVYLNHEGMWFFVYIVS